MRFVRHHHVELAIHELRAGTGRPLLTLHALGACTPPVEPVWTASWPGPVFGLDFTGHGSSTVPVGGGYSAELLMGDVDTALRELGPCTILGHGLGAYVALLIAGARPRLVRGAILADGSGVSGGVPGPTSSLVVESLPHQGIAPDPWARLELSRDPRPADYAISYVRQAVILSGLATPIAVCARWRPGWLGAVADDPAVLDVSLAEGLAVFATVD